MAKYTNEQLISHKKKELRKWSNFINKNFIWLYPMNLLFSLVLLVGGIVLCYSMASFIGVFFIVLGWIMICITIPTWCVYASRRKKAPAMYKKVAEELRLLENKFNGSKKEEINLTQEINESSYKSDNPELVKLKKMLEAGVISRIEFEEKRKELDL